MYKKYCDFYDGYYCEGVVEKNLGKKIRNNLS